MGDTTLVELVGSDGRSLEYGQKVSASSLPVTIASDQTALSFSAAGVDVTGSSAAAAAANNVTLPGVAAKTTYITGFEITGGGATAGTFIAVTVTGTITGTLNYVFAVPTGATAPATPLIVEFARPIPASAANTGITVNVPSFGLGNTTAAVSAHGYQA